jgi:hypothetical protein
MASKFEIRVTAVHEDGTRTPYFFDAENTREALEVNGFAILGDLDTGCVVSIHNTNSISLAQAIDASEHLRLASRMALAVGVLANRMEASDAAQ